MDTKCRKEKKSEECRKCKGWTECRECKGWKECEKCKKIEWTDLKEKYNKNGTILLLISTYIIVHHVVAKLIVSVLISFYYNISC